jgi:hypothetical protein
MIQPFAAIGRIARGRLAIASAAALLAVSGAALAQDPEPPFSNRYEADVSIGVLPFTPGQTQTMTVPSAIPDSATEVLVAATFTCSLVSGQIQGGELMNWTIWSNILHFDNTPGRASFQKMMWCAPGQLTTNQALGWLPISASSRSVFARLNNTGSIPWDNTQSEVKVVSYR